MIHYNSWNEMLRARDDIHKAYIRQYNHGTRWEIVHYAKWSDDCYVGYCGTNAGTLKELIKKLQDQRYDTSNIDICTYKEEER